MYDDTVMVDKEYYNKLKDINEKYQWISVEDRLPENTHLVLICGKGATSYIIVGSYFPEQEYWIDYHFHALNSVTHWMPLPEYPNHQMRMMQNE